MRVMKQFYLDKKKWFGEAEGSNKIDRRSCVARTQRMMRILKAIEIKWEKAHGTKYFFLFFVYILL